MPFVIWNKRATEILGVGATNTDRTRAEIYRILIHLPKNPCPNMKFHWPQPSWEKQYIIKLLLVHDNTYMSCNAKPLVKDGEIIGGIVVFTDITQDYLEKFNLQEKVKSTHKH